MPQLVSNAEFGSRTSVSGPDGDRATVGKKRRIRLKDFDPRHGRWSPAKVVHLRGALPQLVSNVAFGSRTSTPDTGLRPQTHEMFGS